jgi:hypothetical protein
MISAAALVKVRIRATKAKEGEKNPRPQVEPDKPSFFPEDAKAPGNVDMFSFPAGAEVKSLTQTRQPEIRTFTMTDEDGAHIFGHCCVIFQEGEGETKGWFEPCCLCIITKRKHYCSLRLFLACYLKHAKMVWQERPEAEEQPFRWTEDDLQCVYTLLAGVDCDDTASGPVQLHLSANTVSSGTGGMYVNFSPPTESPPKAMPLGDVNMDALFNALPPEAVLDAFTAMLCEQQVLVVSSNMLLIGQVVEALTTLLYPLIWSHLVIPLLPAKLVDVLQAPVPFICGAHSETVANLPPVRAADGSIVSFVPDTITYIDLDEGTVGVPGSGKEVGEVLKEMGKELKDALGSFGKSMGSWTKNAILGQNAMSPGSPRNENRSAMGGGELENPDVVWTPLPGPVRAELLDAINTFAVRPLMQHKLFGDKGGSREQRSKRAALASTAVAAAAAAGRLGEGMGLATVAVTEEGEASSVAEGARITRAQLESFYAKHDPSVVETEGRIEQLLQADTADLISALEEKYGESPAPGKSAGHSATAAADKPVDDAPPRELHDLREDTLREDTELAGLHRGGLVRVDRLRRCFLDAVVSMLHAYVDFGVEVEKKEEVKQELTLLDNGRMGIGTGGKGAKELQGFDDKYDRSSFLKTCADSHKEFISNFVGTQMFVCLVEMRLLCEWGERHPDDLFDCKCAMIKAKAIADEEAKAKKAKERDQEDDKKRVEQRRTSRGYSSVATEPGGAQGGAAAGGEEKKEVPLSGMVSGASCCRGHHTVGGIIL